MNPRTIFKSIPLIIAISISPVPSQAVTIVGDAIDIWSVAQLNAGETYIDTIVVTDPGIEYTSTIVNDIYSLDFGPTSVKLRTINP